jgi:SAM-dependent methyltransferase
MVADSYEQIEEELITVLNESLNPRGPSMLFDHVAAMRIGSNSTALDLGCNTGKYSFELARRFGYGVVGMDISEDYIAEATALATSAEADGLPVTFRHGGAESIPASDAAFELVWCRDTLELVPDLNATYSEVARVLKPGGHALIYTMFATELLEPNESERLYRGLDGIKANSMLQESHEAAILSSKLRVKDSDILGSEWGEYDQEHTGKPARCLLQVARLLNGRQAFVSRYGQTNYDAALADRLWHVYRMVGKLSGHVYVLEKP